MTQLLDSAHAGLTYDDATLDFRTSEGLRQTLTMLAAAGPDAWRTSRLVPSLLAFVERKYERLARAWHRDPAEVLYEAFLALRAPGTARALDPWAVVTRAVELGVAAEAHAERLLTSADKARRPALRPNHAPTRAGEYEEFLFGVLASDEELVMEDDRLDRAGDAMVRTVSVFLVMTGWQARVVEPAVGYVVERLGSLSSTDSAVDVLRKDAAIPLRLGLAPRAWTGLVRLLLGNPRDRSGNLGLLARVLLGAEAPELLNDAVLVQTSRRAAGSSPA